MTPEVADPPRYLQIEPVGQCNLRGRVCPIHARRIGAKLVTQIIRYGSVRPPFTWDSAEEILQAAGFAEVRRFEYGQSACKGLARLDSRERESRFVEAVKPS